MAKQPKKQNTQIHVESGDINLNRLALKSAIVSANQNANAPDNVVLDMSSKTYQSFDTLLIEVECARILNFEIPENSVQAVEKLEEAIAEITQTNKSIILLFDETTGIYTCLNDEKKTHIEPRELTRISDGFIQELIDSENIIYTHLLRGTNLVGLVAVADKKNGEAFTVQDEVLLDIMAPYLTTQILCLDALKQAVVLPNKQHVVNEMSIRLIASADRDSIISNVFSHFHQRLGFDVCQYVEFSSKTGTGTVMFEQIEETLNSYTHAGLESKRKKIKDFTGIISLLASDYRRDVCLHLTGDSLGDRSLGDMFGIKDIQSCILMPVVDLKTGKITAVINLAKTSGNRIPQEVKDICNEVASLIVQAMARSEVLEKALSLASVDELTGLLNRRGLYERCEAEIERARRNNQPICMALIDVDHFKKLNDTYGHLNGDTVLQHLGKLLGNSVRKSDIIARFGGEEFAIILPDTTLDMAEELLERLRANVEKMDITGINNEALKTTISIGVVETFASGKDEVSHKTIISDALSRADECLYQAKNNGRNQVQRCG